MDMKKYNKGGAKVNYVVVRVYTDGACSGNPGPGGWGVIFSSPDGINKYSGCEVDTTNNKMELLAVVKAMEKMLEIGPTAKDGRSIEYVVYSDSAYVINALKKQWLRQWVRNNWITSGGNEVANKKLWLEFCKNYKKLNSMDVRVDFNKVKGHAGNPMNEAVDKLAYSESQNLKAWLELK